MKSSLLFSLVFIFLNVELVCIIAMEVLPIFKNYFQIHGALKFHTMGCTSYAESIVHFDECRIKAIDRAHNSINMRASIKKTLSSVIIIDSVSIIYIYFRYIIQHMHLNFLIRFRWMWSSWSGKVVAGIHSYTNSLSMYAHFSDAVQDTPFRILYFFMFAISQTLIALARFG